MSSYFRFLSVSSFCRTFSEAPWSPSFDSDAMQFSARIQDAFRAQRSFRVHLKFPYYGSQKVLQLFYTGKCCRPGVYYNFACNMSNLMVITKIQSSLAMLSVWDSVPYSMPHKQWFAKLVKVYLKSKSSLGMTTKTPIHLKWSAPLNTLRKSAN